MPYSSADKQRQYQAAYVKKRRDEWIASRGGRCELCGSMDRLEVDHVDRETKLYQPRDIWNRRSEVRHAELLKCQVLCHDCHFAKTMAEVTTAVHGTHGMYTRHRCRCSDCRAGHAADARRYRALQRNMTA